MKITLRSFLGLLTLSLFVSACSTTTTPTEPPKPDTAQVRVYSAAPDVTSVDAFANNTSVVSGVTFDNEPAYSEIAVGNTTFNLRIGGTSVNMFTSPAPVNLQKGQRVTLVALDSAGTASIFYAGLSLPDTTATPASGQAFVRFVHAAYNAGAVSVSAAPVGIAPVTVSAKFKDFTGYYAIPAASAVPLTVQQQPGGVTVLSTSLTLQAGKNYTVFIKGVAGAAGGTALGVKAIAEN
ncbi:MAG: DUF4397 domain-containing protein [Rhizobacter sp.]|nr:DUF4397 domain-containing protein [Chlorobiales bacterium]